MTRATYVELRCHSAFSFLDGASLPEDLVQRAAELGYTALGLTDRDGLYGAPRFYQAARLVAEKSGVARAREPGRAVDAESQTWPLKPLLGAELSLEGRARLLVLVEDRTGYRNLSRLLTQARFAAPRPQGGKVTPAIPLSLLAEHARGLVALTGGGEGAVGRALAIGATAEAERALGRLRDIFGPRHLYVELQRHFDPEEELRNRRLVELAARMALPLVATNDVRYARTEEHRLHDILTCVRHRTTVTEIGRRLRPNAERHLKSPAEMASLFRDVPAAVRATREIAERCSFTLADLGYQFPDYPTAGETEQEHLERLTWTCALTRFRPGGAEVSKGGPSGFCQARR